MKPLIGIVPSIKEEDGLYYLHEDNVLVIEQAGGIPVIIPYQQEVEQLTTMIDGLYLTGGFDIDPTLFGEEPLPQLGKINRIRDEFEIRLINRIITTKKPILAVCRGSQIVNIALGGDMFQDIYSQLNSPLLQHEQHAIKSHASHYVYIDQGSLLYQLVDNNKIKVNSRHHQANRNLGKGLFISGKSSDGVIEAVELNSYPFFLALQWHPENMAVAGDIPSKQIYEGFIKAVKEQKG